MKQKQPKVETPNDSRDNITLQGITAQKQKIQYVDIVSMSESSSMDENEMETTVIPHILHSVQNNKFYNIKYGFTRSNLFVYISRRLISLLLCLRIHLNGN